MFLLISSGHILVHQNGPGKTVHQNGVSSSRYKAKVHETFRQRNSETVAHKDLRLGQIV